MKYQLLCVTGAALLVASGLQGQSRASIAGQVQDESGGPLSSVLVKAKKGGVTATVFSQADGRFAFTELLPGAYDVHIERRGLMAPAQHVTVPASQEVSFTAKPGPPDRASLTNREVEMLLPPSPYKQQIVDCELCHSWAPMSGRVKYRTATWINGMKRMAVRGLGTFPEAEMPKAAEYLQANFGPDAKLPLEKLPPDPTMKGASLKIRYVSYDIPTYNAMPHTAYPDGKGNVWFAEYGGGKIGVVHVKAQTMEEFRPPWEPVNPSPHGITTDKFGNVWFTGPTGSTVGKFDPRTKTFRMYPVPPPERGTRGRLAQGENGLRNASAAKPGPHSLVTDERGFVWLTDLPAGPIIRTLEPETGEFIEHEIPTNGAGSIYGIMRDPGTGRVWYAGIGLSGWTHNADPKLDYINEVGYIDPATNKITRFPMPVPNAGPRRLHIDADGVAWFNLFHLSAVAKADPKTGKVTMWPLPGVPKDSSPYASGLDSKGRIWTSPYRDDLLFRFDPKTEEFTTYMLPTKGNGLRDFYYDENGWMWGAVWGQNQVLSWKVDD